VTWSWAAAVVEIAKAAVRQINRPKAVFMVVDLPTLPLA
jgi:hypothetical protein